MVKDSRNHGDECKKVRIVYTPKEFVDTAHRVMVSRKRNSANNSSSTHMKRK